MSASASQSVEKSATAGKDDLGTKSLLAKVFGKRKADRGDMALSTDPLAKGADASNASPAKGAGAGQRVTAASPAKSPVAGKRTTPSPKQSVRSESAGGCHESTKPGGGGSFPNLEQTVYKPYHIRQVVVTAILPPSVPVAAWTLQASMTMTNFSTESNRWTTSPMWSRPRHVERRRTSWLLRPGPATCFPPLWPCSAEAPIYSLA